MEYRVFGRTGRKVSVLGFGAMNLHRVSLKQADEALNTALDLGINYIDTAADYRDSEEILGKCISNRREEFFLATKTNKRDYAAAKAEIERSLNRLRTDVIDLLQIHYVNYESEFRRAVADDGAYYAALEAKREGKVRYIGITGHRPDLLARWIQEYDFDQVLFHLNLAQPFALDELIPTAARLNMGRTAMKPLSGGFIQPVDKAIRFPYSQDVHTVISGMVSADEVRENLRAIERAVEEREKRELMRLAAELGAHNCRRCNYCSCPVGVPIPDVMISSRVRERFGLLPRGTEFYRNNKDKLAACLDYEPCRETPLCEAKCPYELPMKRTVQAAAVAMKGGV